MTKTIKETIREYDKDGKLIKEVVKETTESNLNQKIYDDNRTGRRLPSNMPDWTYRPELQPFSGGWG